MLRRLHLLLLASLVVTTILTPARATNPLSLDGSGQTIAIIDNGFDTTIPQLQGKVVAEACFAGDTTQSCPDGTSQMIGPGSATITPAYAKVNNFIHGTEMASVAAQVAPGVKFVLIRIGQLLANGRYRISVIDQVKALSWLINNQNTLNIASVSLSIGAYSSPSCSTSSMATDKIEVQLKILSAMNIPVFYAAGNNSPTSAVSYPACLPDAIAISALDSGPASTAVPYLQGLPASFSNYSPKTDFWTSGTWKAVDPGNTVVLSRGTSPATAAVNAFWADVKQAKPQSTMQEVLEAFRASASKFSFAFVQSGLRVDAGAAASLLSGLASQIAMSTPTGATLPSTSLTDAVVDTSLIKPTISNLNLDLPISTAMSWPGGWVNYSTAASDAGGIFEFDIYLQDPKGNRTLISSPLISKGSAPSVTAQGYAVIPSTATVGSIWSLMARAYNSSGYVEGSLGSFTIKPIPEDISRPTIYFNQIQRLTSPVPVGFGIYVSLNVHDDIGVQGAKYVITDPNNKRTIYGSVFYSGNLATNKSYVDKWIVPATAIDHGVYTLSGWAYDAVGNSVETQWETFTVTNPDKLTTPTPTPTPSTSLVPTHSSPPVTSPTVTPSFAPVAKMSQNINFLPLPVLPQYGPGVVLNAIASSGLPVTFTATPATYCRVINSPSGVFVQVADGPISLTGNCTITATQSGNSAYSAAKPILQVIGWVKDQMTITTTSTKSVTIGGSSTITASYLASTSSLNSGISALNVPIVVANLTPSVCSVVGSSQIQTPSGNPTQIVVSALKIGMCNLSLSVASSSTRSEAFASVIFAVLAK
jgi:hypothetical protein